MIKLLLVLLINVILFSKSIDFQTALNYSIQNNKELKAKKLSINKANIDLQESQNYDYGSLIFNSSLTRTNHAGHVFGMKLGAREASFKDFGFSQFGQPINTQPSDLNSPDARSNFENKVSYDVPIFTGFRLTHAKNMAKLQLMANRIKYKFDEKALGFEVLKAYNGAVLAKHFIKATQKAKDATNSFVTYASELYKEGLVTKIDVKQAQVQDLNVKAKQRDALNKFDLAIAYLKFLTNDTEITDIKEFENLKFSQNDLAALQQIAINNRDDFSWMKYNTQTLEAKVKMEKSNNYASLGAHVEYGFNNGTLDEVNKDQNYYLASIGLKYSFFDPTKKTKIQKSKIAHKKAQYYFEYMEDGIKLEVEKNLLTFLSKKDVLKEKLKAKELAQEVLEQSQEMYKNHLINMTNLLMQQANAQKARAQAILSKYEMTLSSAQLKLSLGLSLKE